VEGGQFFSPHNFPFSEMSSCRDCRHDYLFVWVFIFIFGGYFVGCCSFTSSLTTAAYMFPFFLSGGEGYVIFHVKIKGLLGARRICEPKTPRDPDTSRLAISNNYTAPSVLVLFSADIITNISFHVTQTQKSWEEGWCWVLYPMFISS